MECENFKDFWSVCELVNKAFDDTPDEECTCGKIGFDYLCNEESCPVYKKPEEKTEPIIEDVEFTEVDKE